MRSVFADPIAPANTGVTQSGRQSPRSASRTSNATVSRSTVSRSTASRASNATVSRGATTSRGTTSRGTTSRSTVSRAAVAPTRTAVSRTGGANRAVSSRSNIATRSNVTVSRRNVSGRGGQNTNRSVIARGATNKSRVSATGNVIASGSRASANTTYSYLASRLNTGNYSNIIDSTTGMIAADAYSNCMDSYYTCMDEICTARSSAKGRCSCAGRAKNFLAAEQALERANEELITLSGQLALLISTKGKGDDLTAAFSLTDAEKVMNCVSWRDTYAKCKTGETTDSNGKDIMSQWYLSHPTYKGATSSELVTGKTCSAVGESDAPYYCSTANDGNNFGFELKNIDGSSSDILAQLKAWADAKDLAKNFEGSTDNTISQYITIAGVVDALSGITTDISDTTLDSLANKWGYELFEYSHNNVCSRVLDSCFNGIYEACGTPPTVTESDGVTKHTKCTNGSSSNCPFNYNSYISVNKDSGDVVLNERNSSSTNTNSYTSASCFGYSVTTSSTGTRTTATTTTSTTDPYYALRGPVADARRSIMQKYLLDANAACDTYGDNLKKTAQNINYQKVAAEQSLQQKRLEFKTQERTDVVANAQTAIDNFSECLSEIWDCYEEYANNGSDTWTTARIKSYCSQVAQVPHCYEPMICSPLQSSLVAVIDKADSSKCKFTTDYSTNTCRNLVTISEILYGTGAQAVDFTTEWQSAVADNSAAPELKDKNSAALREACLQKALNCGPFATDISDGYCLRTWSKNNDTGNNTYVPNNSIYDTNCTSTAIAANGYFKGCVVENYRCANGYVKWGNQCKEPCPTGEIRENGICKACAEGLEPFTSNPNVEPQECVASSSEYILNAEYDTSCTSVSANNTIAGCVQLYFRCKTGYVKYENECRPECGYALFDVEPHNSIYWTQARYNDIKADSSHFKEVNIASTSGVSKYQSVDSTTQFTKRLAIKLEQLSNGTCQCPASNDKVGKLTTKNLSLSAGDKAILETSVNTEKACNACGYALLELETNHEDYCNVDYVNTRLYKYLIDNNLAKVIDVGASQLPVYKYKVTTPSTLCEDIVYNTNGNLAVQLVPDSTGACKCPSISYSYQIISGDTVYDISFSTIMGNSTLSFSEYAKIQTANPTINIHTTKVCKIN